MSEHHPKNTVMYSAYCKRCQGFRMHQVGGGRLGSCLDCIKRLEAEKDSRRAPAAVQQSLF